MGSVFGLVVFLVGAGILRLVFECMIRGLKVEREPVPAA